MKLSRQLFAHKPEEGLYGDCWRTVIACVFDLDPQGVPHSHEERAGGDMDADRWLAERGFTTFCIPFYPEAELDEVLNTVGHFNPGQVYFLTAMSKIGCGHVVICQDKRIIWDPSGNGIVGPHPDRYWFIEVITRRTTIL